MKKTGLFLAGTLFAAVASTQAVAIYWEGNDDWNGNIGSTDYVDGQSWSDSSNGYAAYGMEPQTGDIALIGNWGQAGTAVTQPILSTAATGVPLELRIGGSDGTFGTLDIVTGGSVSVDNLNISVIDGAVNHGNGTLNVSGGSIIGTALDLGDGNTGIINLTAGLVHVGALTMGAGGSVNLSLGHSSLLMATKKVLRGSPPLPQLMAEPASKRPTMALPRPLLWPFRNQPRWAWLQYSVEQSCSSAKSS